MDENSTDSNQEDINSIENNVTVEETNELSARDSEPYNIPVNKISQDESQPVEAMNDAVIDSNHSDFQNRQEALVATKIKKPKNNKKKLIILVILIIVLASGSAAAYLYLNQNIDNKSDKTATKKVEKVEPKKTAFLPTDAVEAVKTAITAKYSNVVSPDTKLTGDQVAFRTSDTAPYWKVDTEKFYVNYTGDGASNMGVYYVGDSDKYTSAIIESLSSQGFTLENIKGYDVETGSQKAYTKDDVVCTTVIGSVYDLATLNCGQLSKYTKNLESYKATKPFADAYVAGGMALSEGSIFTNIKIEDSSVIGYKTAELSVGAAFGGYGAAGLFYKKGDENWRFFTLTQDIISCTKYNTTDLVNAYRGDPCYDGTKTGLETTSYVH